MKTIALRSDLVSAFVEDAYGLMGRAEPLPGEHDENWLFITGEDRFVFRIGAVNGDPERMHFIVDVLTHLSGAHVTTPQPIRTRNGATIVEFPDNEGVRLAWMTSFVSGTPLSQQPMDPKFASAFGGALAVLDQALDGVPSPKRAGTTPWDLSHPQQALAMFDDMTPADPNMEFRETLEAFAEESLPKLVTLPHATIHNDANPDNVLYEPHAEIFGFIDFGDVVYAPRILEIAIAASYHVPTTPQEHEWATLDSLIIEYCSSQHVTLAELSILPACLRGRLALAISIATYRSKTDPSRTKYVLRHIARARQRLALLSSIPDRTLVDRWCAGAAS